MNDLDVERDTTELPSPAATLRRSARGGMRILIRDAGTVTIFVLIGPAQDDDATRFGESFRSWLESGRRRFVLDLRELTYIDSALIAEIIASLKRAAERSGTLELVTAPRSNVSEILRVTALDRVFRIHDTLEPILAGEGGVPG
jgi:anti-anti-sigma factor